MIEVVAAIVILSVAILPLGQVFYFGTKIVNVVKEDSKMLFTSDAAAEIYLSQDLFTPFMVLPNESDFFDNNKFQVNLRSKTDSSISPAGTLQINRLTIDQIAGTQTNSKLKAKLIYSLHTNVIQVKSLAKSRKTYTTGYKEKILKK